MSAPQPASAPGDLDAQIAEARHAEAQWHAEVKALESEHKTAQAAHRWDDLRDLDARLAKTRQAHATAAGQAEGLAAAARAIAETTAREAAAVAAERQRQDAQAAEARAIGDEQGALAALDARLTDFWGLIAAAQQAFADAQQIEQQVRRHRQARNNAARLIHGQNFVVPAVAPNRTRVLEDSKPGIREFLRLKPGPR